VTFSATATPNATISGTISLTGSYLAPRRGPLMGVRALAAAVGATANRRVAPMRAPPRGRALSDELLVRFRPTALGSPPLGSAAVAAAQTAAAINAGIRRYLAPFAASSGATIVGVSPVILTARIKLPRPEALDSVARGLGADPAVALVERNSLVGLADGIRRSDHLPRGVVPLATALIAPNDPLYPWQSWHYEAIDLPRAWAITTGSASVLVAVVDNGIRFDHPAIAPNLTSDGYDFVSSIGVPLCGGGTLDNAGDGAGYDPDPTIPADYDYDGVCATGPNPVGGHGLHVAGTIGAAGNDGLGVTGVNWTVRIRPVRALGVAGVGTDYDIAQGILYAAGLPADNGAGGTVQASTGARVINLSLGSAVSSATEHQAIIAAANAGALVVAAAGNEGQLTPAYPAAFPEALSVSAVGPDLTLASYSNYAGTSGIAAPGGDQARFGDTTAAVFSTMWNFASSAPTYEAINGTSMAAPHVAGVAALLLAQNPSLTAAQLRARLTAYSVDLGPAGPDALYGIGLVNARNSLTQSFGPPATLYARLYNATTGAIVQTVAAQAGNAYAFSALPDATYLVYAGLDESGDQGIGIPGRLWGAAGGSATPTRVVVAGAGTYPASFTIGLPIEREPNALTTQAHVLPVGGYFYGTINPAVTDLDVFTVVIPQAGVYTFETSGWFGACGFALNEDTFLTLYNSAGTPLASNDDIDAAALNFCSRVSTTLAPGLYYVGVQGPRGAIYRVQARAGS